MLQNPLDLFRDERGFPKYFEQTKIVVDVNPVRTKTFEAVPPQQMFIAAAPFQKDIGGGRFIRLYLRWKYVNGGAVPCGGEPLSVKLEYTVGLQTSLSQTIQSTLESSLSVRGVANIGAKLTATLGITITTKSETKSSTGTVIQPPPTGTKGIEVYQPIVIVAAFSPTGGAPLEFENGLNYFSELPLNKPEPKCDQETGFIIPSDRETMLATNLGDLPGFDSAAVERLRSINVMTLQDVVALDPAVLTYAGISRAEATEVFERGLAFVRNDIEERRRTSDFTAGNSFGVLGG